MIGRFSLLAILVGSLCRSQSPTVESPADAAEKAAVSRLLTDTDPSQLAWGAYLAANYQQKSFSQSIVPLLKSSNPWLKIVAIDALIRLNAELPDDDLSAFALTTDSLDPVLVILERNPDKYAHLLMQLLDRQLNDTEWVAVNGLLMRSRPSTFAPRLLREWTIHLKIQVWDTGRSFADGGCGWGTGRVSTERSGFPPVYIYYLIGNDLRVDGTVLVKGPHPVSYFRVPYMERSGGCISRDFYRMDYLKALADIKPENPQGQFLNFGGGFRWVSSAKYQSDAAAALADIQKTVNFIRQTLITYRYLTPEEAAQGPTLEVVIDETRKNHHEPLPGIDWRLEP